jgi:hypothetical protein
MLIFLFIFTVMFMFMLMLHDDRNVHTRSWTRTQTRKWTRKCIWTLKYLDVGHRIIENEFNPLSDFTSHSPSSARCQRFYHSSQMSDRGQGPSLLWNSPENEVRFVMGHSR